MAERRRVASAAVRRMPTVEHGSAMLGPAPSNEARRHAVAIEGMYQAAADWEAFKKEDARLQQLWGQCAILFGGFLRLAEQTKAVADTLANDIARHERAIAELERVHGEGLHAVCGQPVGAAGLPRHQLPWPREPPAAARSRAWADLEAPR